MIKTQISNLQVGDGLPLLVLAGPCVIESEELTRSIASTLKEICSRVGASFVFKASFDKANRTSVNSYRGLGIEEGLRILKNIRDDFQVPVVTDIHEAYQAELAAQAVDLIQIPAFLSRQTSLLQAAAETGLPINVKKGQFMAPRDMRYVVDKMIAFGNPNVILGERGTFFGYGALVNDFRSLVVMRETGAPVLFDATHSVQEPSASDGKSGGRREYVAPLARAAAAVGIDALFLETHFDPSQSPCDGANMIPLDGLPALLRTVVEIRRVATNPR